MVTKLSSKSFRLFRLVTYKMKPWVYYHGSETKAHWLGLDIGRTMRNNQSFTIYTILRLWNQYYFAIHDEFVVRSMLPLHSHPVHDLFFKRDPCFITISAFNVIHFYFVSHFCSDNRMIVSLNFDMTITTIAYRKYQTKTCKWAADSRISARNSPKIVFPSAANVPE